MPFAAPIPSVWPAEAWDGEQFATPDAALWCALKVHARCEKQVARELTKHAAAYFLCLRTVPKVYQRRRIETQAPLFPGYLFVAGAEEQLDQLWRLRNVAATLTPPSQEQFVEELTQLCKLVQSGQAVTPEEQLQPGDRARIIRGSLKGLIGTVVENRGGMRLILGVTLLGQGVSVDVTPDMVERLEVATERDFRAGRN
jgi:transcription antitermination factor NusG